MKIAIAQINTTNGDISGNVSKIIAAIGKARQQGASIVVFPELVTHGYTSFDWFQDHDVIENAEKPLERILPATDGITAVVGTIRRNHSGHGKKLFNTAAVIRDGVLLGYADKTLLPEYDVFDDPRYFEPASSRRIFEVDGKRLGVVVCEDFWNDKTFWDERLYEEDPTEDVLSMEADIVVALNASPFNRGKIGLREKMVGHRARIAGRPMVFVNLIGGNDGVIFDGSSIIADSQGEIVFRAPAFEETVATIDIDAPTPEILAGDESELESMRRALILGIRDYARKSGFSQAVIGLSGGIDSALVTALACEAMGPENVLAVMMPSPFSSTGSVSDSEQLVENLKCESRIEPISDAYGILSEQLELDVPVRGGESLAAENIQSRLRGVILMAISNSENRLLLSTGNKSELAVGYCTLYGDTNGGLAVLGDILKTDVWALAHHINETARKELIPVSIIEKRPSAELAPNQFDQDTLPDYALMDPVLRLYFEEKRSPAEIISEGHDAQLVMEILEKVERPANEFKRRQLPPTLIVSKNAIGIGRRRPVTHRYSRIKNEI